MSKTVINLKTEKEVKENAKKVAQELGISLSDVLNASLRNFIRTREVRFSSIPRMTPELEKLLGSVEGDIANRKNLSPALSSPEEVEEYLDSV